MIIAFFNAKLDVEVRMVNRLTEWLNKESVWNELKDYHYDLQGLADQINSKTKIIYLANPDNPTGTYFDKLMFDNFMSILLE